MEQAVRVKALAHSVLWMGLKELDKMETMFLMNQGDARHLVHAVSPTRQKRVYIGIERLGGLIVSDSITMRPLSSLMFMAATMEIRLFSFPAHHGYAKLHSRGNRGK